MDTTALIDAEVALVGRLAFSTDYVVMLQERHGPRRLALEPVDATTGEAIERLIGDDQPLAPTTHDLLPRLVAALGGRVEQVTIRRLVGEALYADIILERDGERREVEARPGDAVTLALLASAPIRVAAAVMDAAGFDPMIASSAGCGMSWSWSGCAAASPSAPAHHHPRRSPPRRRWMHRCGSRRRTAWSGCVVNCPGAGAADPRQRRPGRLGRPGDPAAMARYCQAHADRDADLTYLLMREVFPADQVEAVVVRSVGRLWRVEVGIAAEDSEQERERFAHRTDQAVRELETLLQVSTAAVRLSGPDEPSGPRQND